MTKMEGHGSWDGLGKSRKGFRDLTWRASRIGRIASDGAWRASEGGEGFQRELGGEMERKTMALIPVK